MLAIGRLGAYQDRKVVKLATPPDRRVAAHIEGALRPASPAPPAPDEIGRQGRRPSRRRRLTNADCPLVGGRLPQSNQAVFRLGNPRRDASRLVRPAPIG